MENKVRDNVEALLKREDQVGHLCRNNDNFLALWYILTYHSDLDITLVDMLADEKKVAKWAKDLPAISEFKRIRAHFQNKLNRYLSDEQIQIRRKEQEERERKRYRV